MSYPIFAAASEIQHVTTAATKIQHVTTERPFELSPTHIHNLVSVRSMAA